MDEKRSYSLTSSTEKAEPDTKIDAYDLGDWRNLTSVVAAQKGWIVWNWDTNTWDHKDCLWMIQRKYPYHDSLTALLKDPNIPDFVKLHFQRAEHGSMWTSSPTVCTLFR